MSSQSRLCPQGLKAFRALKAILEAILAQVELAWIRRFDFEIHNLRGRYQLRVQASVLQPTWQAACHFCAVSSSQKAMSSRISVARQVGGAIQTR